MNKKVLIFSTTATPFGGVERWLDHAFEAFTKQGYDVLVGLVQGAKSNIPAKFIEFHPTLETTRINGIGLNTESRIRELSSLIKRFRPSTILPLGIFDACAAARREKLAGNNLKVIGRAQGNLPEMLADLQDYNDTIDAVVCPGMLTARYLERFAGYEPERVLHVANGAELPTHPRTKLDSRINLRIGYVGRFTNRDKRILDLPKLCQQLEEHKVQYQLDIVGDGADRDQLMNLMEPYSERFTYHGALKPPQLYSEIYPNIDALILLSSSETFGVVIAESQMNGVVPVTSQYLGISSQKLVKNGETGLTFPIGDMATAAKHLKELQDAPRLLEEISSKGRQQATAELSWTTCMQKWTEALGHIHGLPDKSAPTAMHRTSQDNGRLDRLGIPAELTHRLRKLRRSVLGSPVPAGGEEWPMFSSQHTSERLKRITLDCISIEEEAKANGD